MKLDLPRLILREFRLSDYEAVREYERDPEVQRYERFVSEETARAKLVHALAWADQTPRTHYYLAITLPPADIARGRISSHSIMPICENGR